MVTDRVVAVAVVLVMMGVSGAESAAGQTPAGVTVSGRVQVQYNTTSVEDAAAGASSTFETRRVRLGVSVDVNDWISGRLEPEYALGQVALRQVWVNLAFDPRLELRVGQFKKPFSLLFLTSSLEGAAIERGVRLRGLTDQLATEDVDGRMSALRGELLLGEEHHLLDAQGYLGYELGATVHGALGAFGYQLGVFNGSGPDARDENDDKSFAGRATWSLPVATPLTLGAGVSRRELNWPVAASPETRAGNAYEVDMELGAFRRPGVWLLVEATTGRNLATEESFAGAQTALSFFLARSDGRRVEAVEPVARVSWGDPDDSVSGDEGVLVTPGINLYFPGRNRFMLNWDVYLPGGSGFETRHGARAQINLHF